MINSLINHRHHYHYLYHRCHHRYHPPHHHQIQIFYQHQKKQRKKLQKNNVQNTVTREQIKVDTEIHFKCKRQYKNGKNKKDQNRNNKVIGDSIIKPLNGWDMSKKVHKSKCKIYVKSFPGAETSCMKDLL